MHQLCVKSAPDTCSAKFLADFRCQMQKVSVPKHEELSLHFHPELQLMWDDAELSPRPHLQINTRLSSSSRRYMVAKLFLRRKRIENLLKLEKAANAIV
ncbi:hypothetical protein QYF36_005011 [Acer negundo]|nr:hypothetical protein QYF36_001548 [Acer negundo]KAK4837381.1 hypothetical protein QYF36_005011 [Acer negundo]